MKCPAFLRDRETNSCSHSKLIAVMSMTVVLAVFTLANLLGRETIVGWEGIITLSVAAMGNAQISKYLSPGDKTKNNDEPK